MKNLVTKLGNSPQLEKDLFSTKTEGVFIGTNLGGIRTKRVRNKFMRTEDE